VQQPQGCESIVNVRLVLQALVTVGEPDCGSSHSRAAGGWSRRQIRSEEEICPCDSPKSPAAYQSTGPSLAIETGTGFQAQRLFYRGFSVTPVDVKARKSCKIAAL
jgi:hypothetical protein